jgi:hypothetical protein
MNNQGWNKAMTLLLVAGLALVLSACSLPGGAAQGPEPTPAPTARPSVAEEPPSELPTPLPAEDVGEQALSGAKESYQETWNNYLRDIIAEQVADRQQKLTLLQRYENPRITEQNLGGLATDIGLVEDRTTFNLTNNGTTAAGNADFDVRVTYANGDSDTRTCNPFVQIELDPDDGLWYVINPAPLQIFSVCQP